MKSGCLIFRVHAIRRMFERRITEQDVRHVLDYGETIEDYPNDVPYPSRLILGWCERRPLHIVAAYNDVQGVTIVITVYEPDPQRWNETFKARSAK